MELGAAGPVPVSCGALVQEAHPRLGPAATRCLELVERESPPIPLPGTSFRMLALAPDRRAPWRRLLAFLPCAENKEMIAELSRVLVEVGVADGKADAALLEALDDRAGIRRAVAAVTLRRGGIQASSLRAEIALGHGRRGRRRVALGLAEAGDREGAVALSGILEDSPQERAWEIEEQQSSSRAARPPRKSTANPIQLEKSGRHWRQWWQGERGKVVAANSSRGCLRWEPARLHAVGPAAEQFDHGVGPGQQAAAWTLTGLQGPSDAQVLVNQHVLVAEQGRVTERDLGGNVLWNVEGIQPISVQRLANGNTTTQPSQATVCSSRWTPHGTGLSFTCAGAWARRSSLNFLTGGSSRSINQSIIQIDKAGLQIKQVPVRTGGGGYNEILDNGHLLSLSPGFGDITEFDMEGKVVGRFA